MSVDDLDIGADCDNCGQHTNVMADTWVHQRLQERGWELNTAEGDLCPKCSSKHDGDESLPNDE